LGKQTHHCNALILQKGKYVDTAVIEGKKMFLPGEVSITTSWSIREVSLDLQQKSGQLDKSHAAIC